ncbi:MAG: hypothetical protein M0P77_03025 [Firmicutes bacterium]|nr:hypothetical protein [Bacillota bacterium]
MITKYSHEGQEFKKHDLLNLGFEINEEKDIRKETLYNELTGEPLDEYKYTFNFVGFLINEANDIFSVFPKHFRVDNPIIDSGLIFDLISNHMQKRPDLYMGEEFGGHFESNYPFAAFFGVYDYYQRYGLYIENRKFVKPHVGGKINWKETIRKSNLYINNNNKITLFPYYYNETHFYNTFITECMVFVIDYTIKKFNAFISLFPTDVNFPEYDFLSHKEEVIESLLHFRQQVFRDNIIELIDNLINFFAQLEEGGSYYLKHYTFSSIWEDIVMSYLNTNLKEVVGDSLVFSKNARKGFNFKKASFYPNLANKKHYISPDYYFASGSTQYILDAKYKETIRGIDYKQISYFMFLKDLLDESKPTPAPKFDKTYSALLIPSDKRYTKLHFQMDPKYSNVNSDIRIVEEYLDIKEVIIDYLKK